MKNIKLTILGAVVLVAALALNLRHALNDYGVRDNKLHVEVLAQSNGSGGSSADGSSTIDITIDGTRIDCRNENAYSCSPYDPVYESLKAYRPYIQ